MACCNGIGRWLEWNANEPLEYCTSRRANQAEWIYSHKLSRRIDKLKLIRVLNRSDPKAALTAQSNEFCSMNLNKLLSSHPNTRKISNASCVAVDPGNNSHMVGRDETFKLSSKKPTKAKSVWEAGDGAGSRSAVKSSPTNRGEWGLKSLARSLLKFARTFCLFEPRHKMNLHLGCEAGADAQIVHQQQLFHPSVDSGQSKPLH